MPVPEIFESGDVTDLIGIKPQYLNKFIERDLYGIRPSVRPGARRERRRWFGRDDIFGIALVWWLFETGLRSDVIQYVLNQIANKRGADCNLAAQTLLRRDAEILLITREPRTAKELAADYPKQTVVALKRIQVGAQLSETEMSSALLISVGKGFAVLDQRMKQLGSGGLGG